MHPLINKTKNFVEKNRMTVLAVTVVVLVLVFLFMEDGYTWILNKLGKSKEGFAAESTSENTLYMFYVDWCPHCTSAKPELQQLKKRMENDTIQNQKVEVRLVNAEKEESLASKFKVKGYPTIIFVRQGKEYTYEGERTADAVYSFMEDVIRAKN
jgi:thiol-disulfide isomerase/thioredoxin